MSSNSPPSNSSSPKEISTLDPSSELNDSASQTDRIVLEYLRKRGHAAAEKAFLESVDAATSSEKGKGKEADTVSADDLVKLLISAPTPKTSENGARGPTTLSATGLKTFLENLGASDTDELLSIEPSDRQQGYQELEAWVEGSLDMYRPEFRPILYPIFCHFYLDLVDSGFKDAASRFYNTYSAPMLPSHFTALHHLSTLKLQTHVQGDELAQRFRNEKYTVRMSRSGFGLLVGWLTEGVGGEVLGAGDGFSGEPGKRGRAAVMRVVNNHLRFDVTTSNPTAVGPVAWEESTGLLAPLIPQNNGSSSINSPGAFNLSKGDLKLGPAPIPEELRSETERVLREQAMLERDPTGQFDAQYIRTSQPGLLSPTEKELLPHPPTFQTVDVEREVHAVRDARRRIRLEPSTLGSLDPSSPQAANLRARALPSICAYTLHDVPEGAPCCTFSPDTSLLAVGFAESYIRLWSLKGEPLRGLRSDFSSSAVRDQASLRKIREKKGSTTRKLVGHSGPVYSVDFDPTHGSASAPKHLISSSADGTARLWSMDTFTNIMAFRGHENPVWDVKWSPMGIYLATASRDRTARLWSTDRSSCLRIYAGHLSDVDCVQFHPNSLYLATGSSDWTARLWDVQKGSCVRVFIGHQGSITSMSISPDGKYLATAGEDLAINLWDLGSGKRIKKMMGHTASIYSLSFSAESSLLVSGGADWTVRCWDIKSAGGLPSKQSTAQEESQRPMGLARNGAVSSANAFENEDAFETTDLVTTFPTKRTPITNVQFTPRNLCLVGGIYTAPETR